MEKKRSVAPVVRIRKFTDPKDDAAYWRSKSPVDRLSVVEELRLEYHKWQGDVKSGFQRIYSITKRK